MCGSELQALPDGVQRVAAFLQERGHAHLPVMLDGAARTAQQAADALGVELGQIAKSIVFRRKADDVAVMVVTSGDQRVDERKVEALVCPDGQRLGRADAAFVKAKTGFSIGGVSPVAHAAPLIILVDQSLFRFDEVWAAAGHPNAVFSLTAEALLRLSGAQVIDASIETPTSASRLEQPLKNRPKGVGCEPKSGWRVDPVALHLSVPNQYGHGHVYRLLSILARNR